MRKISNSKSVSTQPRSENVRDRKKSVIVSTNPGRHYEILGQVPLSTFTEIRDAVARAQKAQKAWAALGLDGRCVILQKLLNVFMRHKEELALMMCREMGRPLTAARLTVDYGVSYWKWNLENADTCLKPEVTYKDAHEIAEVWYEPRGVAAVIVPWNFPFSNFTWGVSQNLIVGNTVVFKASEETPLFGKLLDRLFEEAGVPWGVFNQIYGFGETGEALLSQDIQLICFTGSSTVGKKIQQAASERLIPTVLELGGSDPGIIFADVNLKKVIDKIYEARFRNSGQVCNALKRLIVHRSRVDEVCVALKKIILSKKMGDPEDPTIDLGPLVSKTQLDLIKSQVAEAVDGGAKILCGGRSPKNLEGAYFEPTLITNVKPSMRIWREEVFGPVLPIIPFTTDEEAVTLALDTVYGLGCYIFTEDVELAKKVAGRMHCGMVQVNNSIVNRPCNPFGGSKASGLGRENGRYGYHDVCHRKLVVRENDSHQ